MIGPAMMNRQSGSLAPIPVTPKNSRASQEPLLQFPTPPSSKRRSKEGRRSWLFPNKPRSSPIWRPSTGHSPPTPQWPLPRQPITQLSEQQAQQPRKHPQKPTSMAQDEPNPALTRTYTRPRNAPLPPPPASVCSRRSSSSSSSSTTPTLTDDAPVSPRTRRPAADVLPPHPLSPRFPPPTPSRPANAPPSHQRNASFQTRYMNMALSTERIPRIHNILSNVFAWMILLAFVTAPANFCSKAGQQPKLDIEDVASASTLVVSYKPIPSIGLLAASCTIFGLGSLGMLWLTLCWRRNYIWLMNRIYLPLMLNSLAGLIGSLVIIHIQDNMWFSVAAYVSLGIEGITLLLSGALFFYTHYQLLGKLKREHIRETSTKNVVELVKAGKRPPFAPGSVV
ncbi:hypothetical protein N0V93_000181 [Gnomoniopsis smithogilvyi]|uniref:Uncharacterized protein n=1 Tax=Gnomoniopsis smithogilvyi TaxID=1191159 RepID=A0A9W8Z1T2_9PEZI|nr:hypothetical protein N0V93_000181 [Gnomoniopsis smithogilvyi]